MTPESGGPGPRRRPRDRKDQIVARARELFVERGFPNVTMALIAERVGITAGALYRHFDNKSVLLDAVVSESFAHLDEPLDGADLAVTVDQAIEILVESPYLSDLWARESTHLSESARDDLRQRMRRWTHAFVPALRQERPDLDPGQEELVAWALQSVLGFLGSATTSTPMVHRRTVVRASALALVHADLVPTGTRIDTAQQGLSPNSMRERLLIAAIEMFDERGYRDAPMSGIGAAAGVTRANLYGYFESKAELLRAVYERGTHALWLSLNAALSSSSTADEALQRVVFGHVDVAGTWARVRLDRTSEPDVVLSTLAAQREYVAELTALLRAVQPTLEAREARLRVLIALTVIGDLQRTPHLSSMDSFAVNAGRLALAILGEPPSPTCP